MVFGLFRGRRDPRAAALYAKVVEAGRQPAFYERLGVPDTIDGRFELVVLHGGLVVTRLSADEETRPLARDLSETFFADMDRTLREMGVGDLSVPKKMKKVAGAFYGRIQAYESAADEAALAATLARNVYEGTAAHQAGALARYVRAASALLAATAAADVAAGRFALPDPAGFDHEETPR